MINCISGLPKMTFEEIVANLKRGVCIQICRPEDVITFFHKLREWDKTSNFFNRSSTRNPFPFAEYEIVSKANRVAEKGTSFGYRMAENRQNRTDHGQNQPFSWYMTERDYSDYIKCDFISHNNTFEIEE